MSRATLVYILMLVAGVGGLWLIVRAGSRLVAPTDLSGTWLVGGEDPRAALELGGTLAVEQSGRYLRLQFERGLRLDLKVAGETPPDPATGDGFDLRLEGRPWSLDAHGASAAGPLIFRLTGPSPHTFTASRVPADAPARAAAPASAAPAAEAAAAVPAAPPTAPPPAAGEVAEAPTADAGSNAP
jgi:hypothetical protein